jgi:hypothetical protein
MLGLDLSDGFTELAQLVAVLGKELAATLANFVDQRIVHSLLRSSHGSPSIQSISGVAIRGVKRPRRRFITVR